MKFYLSQKDAPYRKEQLINEEEAKEQPDVEWEDHEDLYKEMSQFTNAQGEGQIDAEFEEDYRLPKTETAGFQAHHKAIVDLATRSSKYK